MKAEYRTESTDPSGFVLLADFVPDIVQEIRYYSTYNFIGERIDGYEDPVALLTREAARALKKVSNEANAQGYRLKIFDTYRPAAAVRRCTRYTARNSRRRFWRFGTWPAWRCRWRWGP